MAVISPFICLLPFWKQAKSVGHFGQLKKPDKLVGRNSQIFDLQLAKINGPKWPVEGSQGGTPCPVI